MGIRISKIGRNVMANLGAIHLVLCWTHWCKQGTNHGACSVPKIASHLYCDLGCRKKSWHSGRHWFYFRGGYAFYIDYRFGDQTP